MSDPYTELNLKYTRAIAYQKILEDRIKELEARRTERENELKAINNALEKKIRGCGCNKGHA